MDTTTTGLLIYLATVCIATGALFRLDSRTSGSADAGACLVLGFVWPVVLLMAIGFAIVGDKK